MTNVKKFLIANFNKNDLEKAVYFFSDLFNDDDFLNMVYLKFKKEIDKYKTDCSNLNEKVKCYLILVSKDILKV